MTDEASNREFLEKNQYRDSENIGARIRVHQNYSTNTHPLVRRDDGLRIPEARPVVDYLLSAWGDDSPGDAVRRLLTRTVEPRIEEDGELAVTKESGMFVAR